MNRYPISSNTQNIIVNNLISNIVADGGTIESIHLIRNEYNDLHSTVKKQASLVIAGGAYKSGIVYGFNPQTSGLIPFTFSRTGTATRVNKNGLIETVAANVPRMDYDPSGMVIRTNLLTRSEEFDNSSWIKIRCNVTSNQATAPNGTFTADKIIADGTNDPLMQQNTIIIGGLANKKFTFSVWLWTDNSVVDKSAQLFIYGDNSLEAIGQLNISSLNTFPTRYSVTTSTFPSTPASTLITSRIDINNNVVSAGTYHYAWGAQLEESTTPSLYIPTSASSVTVVDYKPVFKGLIIEKGVTNIISYSSDFSQGIWTTNTIGMTRSTISDIIFPHGLRTKFVTDTSNSVHSLTSIMFSGLIASQPYTFSAYLKNEGNRYVLVRFNDGTTNVNAVSCVVDTLNKSIISTTTYGSFSASTSVLIDNGGYFMVGVTSTLGTGTTVITKVSAMNGAASLDTNGQATAFSGDGISGIGVYALQLEQSLYPTSYIPTSGSSLNRGADFCNTTLGSWYNSSGSTLYSQAKQGYDIQPTSRTMVSLSLDSTHRWSLYRQSSSKKVSSYVEPPGNSIQGFLTVNNSYYKGAASIDSSSHVLSSSGNIDGLQSHTLSLSALTNINIGNALPSGGEYYDGVIKTIAYFPSKLSNTDLQSITK